MLILYIVTGVAFMLLPGTLVGVLSLFKISAAHTPGAVSTAWIQAHGHAQIFGWLGTFILGIGYYAIPRLRLAPFSHAAGALTYGFWTAGVAMRWFTGTWTWNWRVIYPLSGVLELTGVAIFAISVYLARPRTRDESWRKSVVLITSAGWAMVTAVAINAAETIAVARHGSGPVFPFDFNQRFLVLITWGFVVPFIWGFTSRWIPALLGLRPTHAQLVTPSLVVLFAGVILANPALLLIAAAMFAFALRIFERPRKDAKLRGVHEWTPAFIRIAYGWSIVAASIAIVAAMRALPNGYTGAGRHALTVGFFAATVFTIGPRVLPAFFNVRRLWSTKVMAASLVLLNAGCLTRVVSEIVAYEHMSEIAWPALALSAMLEVVAVLLFGANMLMTLTTGSPLEAYLESQAAQEA